jgi:glycosyltransferase involved in cell wall biosynthesis
MLRQIAGQLARDGYDVTVFSTQPSYNSKANIPAQQSLEILDGFKIVRILIFAESKERILSRIFNFIYFVSRLIVFLIKNRDFQVYMSATTPPIIVSWLTCTLAKLNKSLFFYHCQDIHPEIAIQSNIVRSSALTKFLEKLDCMTCKRADAIIVLSADMKKTISDRINNTEKVHIINNFFIEDGSIARSIDEKLKCKEGKFRVLFAGNLGLFQGLDAIVNAALILKNYDDIEFVFLGEGAAKKDLIRNAGDLIDRSVYFFPYQPLQVANLIISHSSVCITSLNAGLYRYAYPSKVINYASMGRGQIALVDLESELAKFINSEGIGVAVPPGDSSLLAQTVQHLASSPAELEAMQINAIRVSKMIYNKSHVLKKWSDLYHREIKKKLIEF